MKSILLVRVSTYSQDYEAQKLDLIDYAKQLGVEEYHIIEDKESAIKLSEEERNGLNSMKEWIQSHPDYNSVIVWEISRLARSEKVLHSMKQYFLDNHIQLYIYDKKYKLLNDDGTENRDTGLLFSLYAYFAEAEMKLKKERFQRSKRMYASMGRYTGGHIKYGYKLGPDKYVIPDEIESQVVKDLFVMYASGKYSLRTLCIEMRIRGINFELAQLSNILSFNGYIGETDPDNPRRRSNFRYPPIITKELYDKVQKIKADNVNGFSKSKRYYLSTMLIKCPVCGSYYSYGSSIYSCNGNSRYHTCKYHIGITSTWADVLLWYIASKNHKVFLSIDRENQVENLFQEIKVLLKKTIFVQNQINKIKQKSERADMLFINMKVDEKRYNTIIESINKEIEEKEEELHLYDVEIENKQIMLEQIESGNLDKAISDHITLKEMRPIVRKYIDLVHVYEEKGRKYKCTRVEVTYNKMNENGTSDKVTENYYYYGYCKKIKFEFNGEIIDDVIKEECGKTLDAIFNDPRNLKRKMRRNLMFPSHLFMYLMMAFYTECH